MVASGDKAWIGWPSDKKLEALRDAWFNATDAASAKKAADAVQLEASKFVPVYSDRAIRHTHGLSVEPLRRTGCTRAVPLERREEIATPAQ